MLGKLSAVGIQRSALIMCCLAFSNLGVFQEYGTNMIKEKEMENLIVNFPK